jgi:hypothetical protein
LRESDVELVFQRINLAGKKPSHHRLEWRVTVHGSEALVFKGFVSVDERFGAQNGPRLCRNPLISCCSTRERLRMEVVIFCAARVAALD